MPASSSRIAYIDWLRGLACVLMFQTHCYDAWLGRAARNSKFATWSQLGGTFPAPLFLFLAGMSLALVVNKLISKGMSANQIARTTIRRGAEILGLGLLFRIQEYAISLGWAPWSDLFRVDILNTIGLSLMLMGAMCWAVLASQRAKSVRSNTDGPDSADAASVTCDARAKLIAAAMFATCAIAAFAPLLWTMWRPRFLPWELETYINGVHNLGQPQPWLFPIFPWTAFAFAGLAFGFLLPSESSQKLGAAFFLIAAGTSAAMIYIAKVCDSRSWQIYPVFDFWHTSPEFFVIRVGLLLLFVLFAYGWCRWGPGQWGFSPMIQLGRTSLLVYWVHIELVYGRFSILPRQSKSVLGASWGLLIIFVAMLGLSLLRTNRRGRLPQFPAWQRRRAASLGSS